MSKNEVVFHVVNLLIFIALSKKWKWKKVRKALKHILTLI
jgi:F0F1-type ATP synthase membrane subunit b/b'